MNKKALIRTQLFQQMKILSLFMAIYVLFLAMATVIENYTTKNFSFDGISYFLTIYLVISLWVSFSSNITFYSYHSFSRETILSRMMIVQMIVSLVSASLIELHNLLVLKVPFFSFIKPDDNIKNVYIDGLSNQIIIRAILTILFTALVMFCVLQLTNLAVIITYSMKQKKIFIILAIISVLVVGIILSLPYWTKGMFSLLITIFGFVSGISQSVVPSIVIPLILILVVTIIACLLSRRLIKKLEVHKTLFI
ncbi:MULTISPECIES: hypothetical protein [Vagococcus]|uniref:Uncharacterized protein n=1 Tax=Vagococcus fluvialis bH819 TaxID=1255619 RepID=A0A1X6WSC9_9ENTE|nr:MULTISPECIES: hypothetical protein [Vagococcus]SLM87200.1 hypothetical protein FM121_13960 [Vagococcus fluvialis bH819]HCM90066.1 hypothetical protein [Vagococcus sp.]